MQLIVKILLRVSIALIATSSTVFAQQAETAGTVQFNRDIRPILSDNCFGLPRTRREQSQGRVAAGPKARRHRKRRGSFRDIRRRPRWSRAFATSTRCCACHPPTQASRSTKIRESCLSVGWHKGLLKKSTGPIIRRSALVPRAAQTQSITSSNSVCSRTVSTRSARPLAVNWRAASVSISPACLPTPNSSIGLRATRDPQAYAKLVDRLLASPRFGERLAVYWLDLVRYADTTGFHNDVPYNVYPYRDYVIRSFNSNKPFDEFTREQLGGDLMPNPTDEQLVASAYNRLNRLTTEGGAQAKEYLAKYASNRVSTTATVWLGSTMGCAECHDHKFDPFLTKEFYQIGAFFADIEEKGVFGRNGNYGPRHPCLAPAGPR